MLDEATQKNVNLWLEGDVDENSKDEIRKLLQENPKEVTDAFYTKLSFGTGGLRGIMGVGTNRMNRYTVRMATQGLANYLLKQPETGPHHAVFIGYDSRHRSRFFAEESAKVLAGNGIQVYLCTELRPTPLVSFGCRYKQCSAAIMITASHNPPKYNGYKVYWNDGGQVISPHDQAIIKETNGISDLSKVKAVDDLSHELITLVGKEVDEAYLETIRGYQHYPEENKQHGKDLKVIFTSLHGTGITLVPETLKEWGFTNLAYVESQIVPDGDFPTVKSPNPEERKALQLGIETLEKMDADLLIATDPDADRVGVAIKHEGEVHLLNGNQVACICLYHICEALTAQGRMPKKAGFVKTIATTELFKAIAEGYSGACFDVLTGFKYIAALIREWEQDPDGYRYIFGGEE
ncbi:MAG: phospho-sugar mutase, partial [Waddliaceae bacterium]